MNESTLREAIKGIVSDFTHKPDLQESDRLKEDLGIFSTAQDDPLFRLVCSLENDFGIVLKDSEYEKWETVAHVINTVRFYTLAEMGEY